MKYSVFFIVLILFSCSGDKECVEYHIPSTDVKPFSFMSQKGKNYVYTNYNLSMSESDTFFVSRTAMEYSNQKCSKLALGTDQNEKRTIIFKSNSFKIAASDYTDNKFQYTVYRSSYEDSVTNHFFVLGNFRSNNFVLDTLNKIKFPNDLYNSFIKKKFDSVTVFSIHDYSNLTHQQKDYVSSVYWSDNIGLVAYELNEEFTFILDTIIPN